MTKGFKTFLIIWFICVALFNVICFIVPNYTGNTQEKQAVGFISINIAFFIMLIVGFITSKDNDIKKVFLNLPLISITYTGLIIILIFGIWSMIDPRIPTWISIVISIIILAITIINLIFAKSGSEYIESVENKIEEKRKFFIEAKEIIKQMEVYVEEDEKMKNVVKELKEDILYGKNINRAMTNEDVKIIEEMKNVVQKMKNKECRKDDIEKIITELTLK